MELSDAKGGLGGLLPSWLPIRGIDLVVLSRRAESTPGAAQDERGIGIVSFLTAFVVALIVFATQSSFFLLLRNKLARIL